MSVGKKNKDHLNEHSGLALAAPAIVLNRDDPLQFWTDHPTENSPVDLRPFANGEMQNEHPNGPTCGNWGGPFTGRPTLIAELAPALQARCALLTPGSVTAYFRSLRAWWRLFDAFESTPVPGGGQMKRVASVADLNELHEAVAHRRGIASREFYSFVSVANDARRLLRLPALLWVAPRQGEPDRALIPEDQARELKTELKRDWERVRHGWSKNDAIRAEAERRLAGVVSHLGEEDERLLKHWQHFRQIVQATGQTLPSGEQLLAEWKTRQRLSEEGLELGVMRAILHPTVEEADIAFHLALMNSGWNPSTLAKVNAASPFLLTDHPKNEKQLVLSTSADEEMTLQADKPRARGKTQFCTGLKKHVSSAPVIVATYLKRVEPLREQLQIDYRAASAELERLDAAGDNRHATEEQYKRVQQLRQGCQCVWLYLDRFNQINWITGEVRRYGDRGKQTYTYLGLVIERLNKKRASEGKALIPPVTASDLRDIYARWVFVQTGGNVLAVMLALGHSSLGSTARYLNNNLVNAENDEKARLFMHHLFAEFERGRVDLTILAQLVRNGPLTPEMEMRLAEYRNLMRSRIGAACADPRHPPSHVAPGHKEGRLCGTHRCLMACPHATFLPESLDGIAMRVEELLAMSDHFPREIWLRGAFQGELDEGEELLDTLYPPEAVANARDAWRKRILEGSHPIPGLSRVALP